MIIFHAMLIKKNDFIIYNLLAFLYNQQSPWHMIEIRQKIGYLHCEYNLATRVA
jgi:hypothetical protein